MDIESQLHAAMDRAAVSLLKVLENDEVDDEGRQKYGMSMKMSAFTKAQEWLTKRKKLAPEGDDAADGVAELRRMVDDPEQIVDRLRDNPRFHAALEAAGWIKEPPPKVGPGRLTAAEKARRVRYAAAKDAKDRVDGQNDDSQLRDLLTRKS